MNDCWVTYCTVRRRLSTTTAERWSHRCRSSRTPTPTSCRRWCRSCSTRCSSRATTSSERARSAPRCTSSRRASSTSSPRPAKWLLVCRTAPISEVDILGHICLRVVGLSHFSPADPILPLILLLATSGCRAIYDLSHRFCVLSLHRARKMRVDEFELENETSALGYMLHFRKKNCRHLTDCYYVGRRAILMLVWVSLRVVFHDLAVDRNVSSAPCMTISRFQ